MSDFLARLGARHSAEPTIRPRAASRFELASPHEIDRDAADLARATVDVERNENPRAIYRGSEPVARAAPPFPTVAPPRSVDDVGSLDRSPLERDSLLPSREIASRVARVERAVELESRAARQAELPRPRTDVTGGQLAEVVPRPQLPREMPAITTRVAERVSLLPDSSRAADGVNTPATPDVVRVHIGRVEVRAVMSADDRARPRGAKSSDAPGPLSLDRYLTAKGRP
jgi:hypothetical protein